jgi:hypothetical protein
VDIIIPVARHTLVLRVVIGLGRVALVAGSDYVLPQQGIATQVMIEPDILTPAVGRVTLVAIVCELAGVHVTDAVAARALLTQLLF